MNISTAKALYTSPLGLLTLTASDCALTGLYMEGQRFFREEMLPFHKEHPVLREALDWLEAYFSGQQPDPGRLVLTPQGTAFQKRVWKLLGEIPYGETVTYGELARQLGNSYAGAQAVGGAVGRNPISIIIPCHRVLGVDGSLVGYAGGLERKKWLLLHEKGQRSLD